MAGNLKSLIFSNKLYRNKKISPVSLDGVGARDIFPCFDQIYMKAKFEILLHHDKTVQGLSNSAIASTKKSDWSIISDTFENTGKIATFSVAIAFLDITYQHKESFVIFADLKISSKIFYENSRWLNHFDNTHRIICNIFKYFLEIFNVPLKKLDIVIMPDVITIGYYGFIFINKTDAIAFVTDSRISKKYKLLSAMCLAISRQWLGYVVTMSHWYENWVIQGFNRFLPELCVHKFLPESENAFSQFELIDSFLEVLEAESEGRHNRVRLLHAPEFEYVPFNEQTRKKVYHLIRMMNFFLGSEVFQQGVRKFMEHFKFSVSTVANVWNTFTTVANDLKAKIDKTEILPDKFTVDEIMETWTNQNGLPLISVSRNHGRVTVKQKPYPSLYKMEQVGPMNKCWIIPLSYTTKKEHEFENVVVKKWSTCDTPLSVTIPDLNENDWVLFNLNMNVLARVNYDEDNWRHIGESLLLGEKYSGIDVLTRATLVSDMFALAEIGEVPYNIVFDTMKYLIREEQYAVWKIVATEFNRIKLRLHGTKLLEQFENYVRTILGPILKKEKYQYNSINDLIITNEDSEYLSKQLILELSCKFNVGICRKISVAIIERWKTRPEEEWSKIIPININTAIHCQGVKHKNADYRKKLRFDRGKTTDDDVKNIILGALGCAQNSGSLERHLKNFLISHDEKLSENALKSLVENEKAYRVMKNNFKGILKAASENSTYNYIVLLSYLFTLLDNTNIQKDLNEVWTFAKDLNQFIGVDFESIHFEKAHINIRWLQKYTDELKLYLNRQKKIK